ncbi:hypothetical protein AB0K00_40670 [Dactylosporangium sp. NPDC049525]|uniref:hypothetical protein n=1 Tax=Dactylosporangium sp. NPDC049525 TaxID=3154730 RepID=UPI00343CED5B
MSSTEDVPTLTGTQLLALVVLMAEARPLNNNELKELAGFSLTGGDNKKLVNLGLVETDKSTRPFSHELTEKGWAVIQKVRTPPARAMSAHKTLVTLLTNIDRALSGRSSHAMFFTRSTPAAAAPEPVVDQGDDLETQVRLAYDKLSPAPGEWVSLADLREALSGMDRPLLDATLRVMARLEDVRIIPTANTKVLDDRELSAALQIGDELNHVLSIGAAV